MAILGVILLIITAAFAVPAIFMWLWNITCPQVFNLSEITYWQAFRLLLLAAMLFGGFHLATSSGGTPPGPSYHP